MLETLFLTEPSAFLSILGPTTKLSMLKEACSDFNIQWENLKILSPRFKCGPQFLHPSDQTPLDVSLKFDHLARITPDSLLIFTDGFKDGPLTGSGAIIFKA